MRLQTSEDEKELGWSNYSNTSLFHCPILKEQISRISPRLALLYDSISNLFETDPLRHNEEYFSSKAEQYFKALKYEPAPFDGPICNKDTELKSVFCYDCNKRNNIIFCAQCFVEEQHKGHYFTVDQGEKGLCDCGSDCLSPESCCPKHQNFKVKPLPFDKGAEGYQKELQFLIYFLLRVKRELSSQTFRHRVLWQNFLEKIVEATKKSFLYQSKTSDILIKPLSDSFKYEIRPVIEIFFSQKWSKSTLLLFNNIYIHLYPVKIARKKILMELLKIYSSPFESYQTLQTLTKIFFQFSPMDTVVLKLFKKNIVKPIACYQPREDYLDCLNIHILIYYCYDNLSRSALFPQILKTILEKTNIKCFFNIPPCNIPNNEQSKKQKAMFEQFYMRILLMIGKTIVKMENHKEILKKIIRECYEIVIDRMQDTLFCGERTLGVLIFIYFDCDLSNILKYNFQELKDLLNITADISTAEYKQKILNLLLLFTVSMVSDIFSIVPQSTGISINYCYVHFLILYLFKIYKETNEPLSIISDMVKKMDQNFKEEIAGCLNLVSKTDQEFNQNNLMNQIQLASWVESLCKEGIKVILLAYGVLTTIETGVHEMVISNLLEKSDKTSILNFYKELTYLYPGKTVKELKDLAEAWVPNEPIFQDFILNQYEHCRNAKQSKDYFESYSGISFYSQYTGNQFNEQNSLRLKMKLNSKRQEYKYQQLIDEIFDKGTCEKFLVLYRSIITVLSSKWLVNSAPARQHLRISTSLLIILYAERKVPSIREFLLSLKGNVESDPEFSQRLDSIILMLQEQGKTKQVPKSPEIQSPEVLNSKAQKKMQILKQLKQKQTKYLSQNCPQPEEDNENICIICRQSKKEEPLQYLCRIKFSNALNYTILEDTKPIMIITTCGHKIHERCLAQNLEGDSQYGVKYKCFLCKRASNLRLPMITADASISVLNKIIEELLTIVSLEFQSNQQLSENPPEDANLPILLITSLSYQLYLYNTCCQKLFKHYMLPVYDLLVSFLLSAQKYPEIARKYESDIVATQDKDFRLIISTLIKIVNGEIKVSQSYAEYMIAFVEKHGLGAKVVERVTYLKERKIASEGKFDINLFSVPKELYQLSASVRKCMNCHQLFSRLQSCLLCGFKTCELCKSEMVAHRKQIHVGTSIVVELFNGSLHYETSQNGIKITLTDYDYLYKNYAGEELPKKFKGLLQRDKYTLDQKCYEKAFQDLILQNIGDIVQEKVGNRPNLNCAIQ